MINFDFLTLKAFLIENIDFLLHARLQKIQQPTRQELVFTLRNLGQTRKFYININPKYFHLCFMGIIEEDKRMLEFPKSPPMFCMLLRKYLEGAKIAKINQPEGERILELYFETYNELSEKIYLCLTIELMGRHSNVILYNYDTNVIIGCAHNVGAEKSRERELRGGLPYAYPPTRNGTTFTGFSQFLEPNVSVNETIDKYFADLQANAKFNEIKSRLLTITKTKFRKTCHSLEKIEEQTVTKNKADLYRKMGDLIMANLFNNKDFSSEIEVLDYETNLPIKIELDVTLTLKDNANHYYKLYNKAKTAFFKTQEMVENLRKEKEYLEQILYSIESVSDMSSLFEIKDEIDFIKSSVHPKSVSGAYKQSKMDKNSKIIDKVNILNKKINNFTVYIGKNNKQNDYIVSKLARQEDLWFHVHNCAGSHVLLRIEAGQKPDDKIIFECAKLAKEYSTAKNSSKVGVIYTKRKFLKKPPSANLGYVTYSNEKEIIVN